MNQEALDRITAKVLAHDSDGPNVLDVIAGSPDKPLVIADIEIPCYVLADETRVISQRGFFHSIGRPKGGQPNRPKNAGYETLDFLGQKWIKPFINNDLLLVMKNPILFNNPSGGGVAIAYPATVLADVCTAILDANVAGATTPRQQKMVDRAGILLRGFAKVGVIALVDESTGYQRVREERALAKILERFIAAELQTWVRTFPMEFYREICRLRGWDSVLAIKRPSLMGKFTNDIVYDRLAPGVLEELKRLNPTLPQGGRKDKHHQWLTPDLGHPKLKEHLAAVIAGMRASSSWPQFKRWLQRAFPKVGETKPMGFDN